MACQCGSEYIVNKKYNCCQSCNFLRIHGKTEFEVSITKAKQKMKDNINKERSIVTPKKKRVDHSKSDATKLKRQEVVRKDRETYEEVWLNKPNECENCGSPLPSFFLDEEDNINAIWQYSHILGKGNCPEFRHKVENFNRLCFKCHGLWEFAPIEEKKKMKIYEPNQIIIQQLYDERNGL